MARAMWTGSVAFGLVNVPVRMYNATSPKQVRFHQLDPETGRRIRYRRVAERDVELAPEPDEEHAPPDGPPALPEAAETPDAPTRGEAVEADSGPPETRPAEVEVPFEELVKGFELDRERFVVVDPRELEALRPEQTHRIEIEDFVELSEIDPVHFEKSYYLTPQRGVGAEKPYALLLRAMEDTNRIGLGRFVLRSKEYLAAIRPAGGLLGLETMFFADEIRSAAELGGLPPEVAVSDRELSVAKQLIRSLTVQWEPERYRDAYRERVLELIERRASAQEIVRPEEPDRGRPGVPDLMEALRRSVEEAKERRRSRVS